MGLGQLLVPMGRQPYLGQRPTFAEDKVGVEHGPSSPNSDTLLDGLSEIHKFYSEQQKSYPMNPFGKRNNGLNVETPTGLDCCTD